MCLKKRWQGGSIKNKNAVLLCTQRSSYSFFSNRSWRRRDRQLPVRGGRSFGVVLPEHCAEVRPHLGHLAGLRGHDVLSVQFRVDCTLMGSGTSHGPEAKVELDLLENKPCCWRPCAAFSEAGKWEECGEVAIETRNDLFYSGFWPLLLQ